MTNTIRKETESELLRSRELLDVVLDYAPGFIIAIDEGGRIEYINRVLPQHDRRDVIGADWLQYVPPGQREMLRACFASVMATGEAQNYETSVLGPNGDKIWMTTHMGPIRREGRIVGAVLVAQEITELRRTQIEFAAAQRMAAVGSLAAGMAHEINTPIQFVGDSVQFLNEATRDLMVVVDALQDVCRVAAREPRSAAMTKALDAAFAAEEKAELTYIRANVQPAFEECIDGLRRVASIVRSVREFAHPPQNEMTATDLNRAIENTLTIARSEYVDVADLVTELGPLPHVTCQTDKINQVVLNLVVNAAHAIADVTKVSGEKGRLTVRTRAEGDEVIIAVSDTGTGIADAVRDRIFEPFFTTKEVGKGTGQGLALAWKVVTEQHGGALTYETALGKGTSFFVRLPAGGKTPSAP